MKQPFLVAALVGAIVFPVLAPADALPGVPRADRALAASAAPPVEDQKKFFLEVLEMVGAGQDKAAREHVIANKELARHSFQFFLKAYPSLKEKDQKEVVQTYLTLVAGTFYDFGEKQLVATLKKNNLWVPRKASASSSAAATSSANSEMNKLQVLNSLAVRFGNFRAAGRMAATLRDLIEVGLKGGDPAKASELELPHIMARFLVALDQAFGGQPQAAIEDGEKLLEPLRKAGERDLDWAAHAILVYAGRQAARPDVVDRYLPSLQVLARQVKTHKGSLYRFVSQTWALERELELNPQLTPRQFLDRSQAAWKELNGYSAAGDTQAEGRLFGVAARFWMRQLEQRSNLEAGLAKAYENQKEVVLKRSLALLEESIKERDPATINPEFTFLVVDLMMDMAEYARDHNQPEQAKKWLDEISPLIAGMARDFKLADEQWMRDLSKSLDSRMPEWESLRKQGVKLDLEAFKFSLLDGDVSRLLVRYHKLCQRQAEIDGASDLAQKVEMHLSEAEKYQELLTRGQGYQGLEDASWDRLAYLSRKKPANWATSARPLVEQALKINEELQFRPGLITALIYDGESKIALAQKAEAQASLQRAISLLETYAVEVGSGLGAAQVRTRFKRAYELLAELQIQEGKNEDAFSTLGRSQQLQSVVVAEPASPEMFSVNQLRTKNDMLESEMMQRRLINSDTKPLEELLAKNKAEFHTTLNLLRQRNPRYESLLAIRPVNFSKQQKFIPANTALIQYFPADDSLYIFVATSTDLKIRRVPISQRELFGEVANFRKICVSEFIRNVDGRAVPEIKWNDETSPNYGKFVAPLKGSVTSLHKHLIEPVESDIADKEVLAFIPTGMLGYLPMQALARSHPEKGLEFLIERKQCVTLLKSSDIDQLSHEPASSKGSVLALGNPDGSLPQAEKEVEAITNNFPGSQKFVRNEARKEKFSPLGPGIAYLHFATHGRLDSHDPNSSYLLLAGNSDQARLRVPQIYELKLDGVRLVTLSACETALAEGEPGSELASLADAFSVAGTNSVLASLWSVSDDSTRDLMARFYSQLKDGKSLSQSLQSAETAMLANPRTAHPFFWAPFTLIGDWR